MLKALLDFGEKLAVACPCGSCVIAGVEHIRHLFVRFAALARSGRHNIAPCFIGPDDLPGLFKLLRAGKRAAAEFYHFLHSSSLFVQYTLGISPQVHSGLPVQ